MTDDHQARLIRIAGKLTALRDMPEPPKAFGVASHGFRLADPLPEAAVAEFEERHEVSLPAAFRLFVTQLGSEGAGPGHGLTRLTRSCCRYRRSGHLARPSGYLPGPRYRDDWEQRHEQPPGPDRILMPGTLVVADHGCSLVTRLVVTGPARGRLINLDHDGPVGPYVVEDPDFLSWYERWLDETLAGYDVGWFGERLPLDEAALIAVLADGPSPDRRIRAGESLGMAPVISTAGLAALATAVTSDDAPVVRAALLRPGDDQRESAAREIAGAARARTPVDLEALVILGLLTLDDVLAELATDDLERRRAAAYRLAWDRGGVDGAVPADVAAELIADPDPLLRSHGIALVQWFAITALHPELRRMQGDEADPWVRHWLDWCLHERPTGPERTGLLDPPF
ncbi:hypothetical protein [Actinoplanes couchii]|uniref:Knr4/Smi1-like domain-containing protein n=1 Tax=Actinoplanes couchii TaxID=403638 RepID=A0ABQ3XN91_9ACTN|nr:hypothetical protein [Actinoplanes couchii]MDR6317877.1 hypothetical protein [Actinoplanes couchii]GID59865.1 hypothetical protein Aco03nite_082690 [Actinoplanes couchii]